MSLHSVSDSERPIVTQVGLPMFEGEAVETARFKLAAVGDLEASDTPVRIDEVVKLYVEGRVTRVDHVVDEKTGNVKRVQTIKVVEALQLGWDFDVDTLPRGRQ